MDSIRKRLKRGLDQADLLDVVEPIYFNVRSLSARTLWQEIRPGGGTAPDGLPYPPASLIYDVIASRWRQSYWTSGNLIVNDMTDLLRAVKRPIDTFESILDFGCGCGRLLRHVEQRTNTDLHGSDYNDELVRWCSQHLPFASFSLNAPEPPFGWEDHRFDLVYARSVFTHLLPENGLQWSREVRRVLKPGGVLYFTMHGVPLAGGLDPQQRHHFDEGGMVVTYASVAGRNLCSTYAGRSYVEDSGMLDGFRLLDFIEGRDVEHLRQDIYIAEKEAC
jgi:SAM-dependent methyltransferase